MQNGRETVSTIVLAESELAEQLKAEALLHTMTGWKVAVSVSERRLLARKGKVEREIFFRDYDAMDDYESRS